MPVMHISRAAFLVDCYEEVCRALEVSRIKLEPVLRALPGFVRYWIAIDRKSNTFVQVSVWNTLGDAKQLDSLPAMLVLAGELVGLGVSFEAPITNSDVLWEL